MKKTYLFLFRLMPLLILLLAWEFIFSSTGKGAFLYSKPTLILASLIENFKSGLLINDLKVTGSETLFGFLLGNSLGLMLGFSLWYSKLIAYISKPYIIVIGSIPIFSLAPMTIIWFGTGMFAKVMMAAISTFAVSVAQSYDGAQQVDESQIKLLKTFGASRWIIFRNIIIPSSFIWVISSLRLNVSLALLGAFIGEFISSDQGLGHRILKASSLYDTTMVFSALLCLIFLAFVFNWGLGLLEKKVSYWKNQS